MQVTRSWPNRLVIVVQERTPVLVLPAYGGGYDVADAHGVVLQRVTRRPAGLPLYPTVAPEGALRGDPDRPVDNEIWTDTTSGQLKIFLEKRVRCRVRMAVSSPGRRGGAGGS